MPKAVIQQRERQRGGGEMVFLDRSSKQFLLPSVLVITDLQKTPIRNPTVDKQLRTLIDILIMFVFCFFSVLFCFTGSSEVLFLCFRVYFESL